MAQVDKMLGQARPANTTAVSIYSPTEGVTANVFHIVICNTTGTAATFRIFHDDAGTTYDQTTALYYDKNVNGAETLRIYPLGETGFAMNNPDGNLAVRTGTASALTFTVYGTEKQ